MSDMDYGCDDFPDEFDEAVFEKPEENIWETMGDAEFRKRNINHIEMLYKNQEAIHEATKAGFELMEKRLQELEWKLQGFQKKVYGDSN